MKEPFPLVRTDWAASSERISVGIFPISSIPKWSKKSSSFRKATKFIRSLRLFCVIVTDGPKLHKKNCQMSSVQFTCVVFHEGWTILSSHTKPSSPPLLVPHWMEPRNIRFYHKTQCSATAREHPTTHTVLSWGKREDTITCSTA